VVNFGEVGFDDGSDDSLAVSGDFESGRAEKSFLAGYGFFLEFEAVS